MTDRQGVVRDPAAAGRCHRLPASVTDSWRKAAADGHGRRAASALEEAEAAVGVLSATIVDQLANGASGSALAEAAAVATAERGNLFTLWERLARFVAGSAESGLGAAPSDEPGGGIDMLCWEASRAEARVLAIDGRVRRLPSAVRGPQACPAPRKRRQRSRGEGI